MNETLSVWVAGARPRTLPAAVAPILAGSASAAALGRYDWLAAALCLVVALALQVGVNYANDYSDGVKGTDNETRVGPMRLVGSGAASPGAVKRAAFLAFGVAAIAGLALTVAVGPILLVVGAASFAAGWFYTGGPRPYGYAGLGEVFVFVFFGLVATIGSAYVQTESLFWLAVGCAVPVGFLATALLVVNNLRDIPTDAESGKITLAVRMGDLRTRWFYVGLLIGAFLCLIPIAGLAAIGAAFAFIGIPFARKPVEKVLGGATGPALIPVLGATGRVQMIFGALLTLGLALSL